MSCKAAAKFSCKADGSVRASLDVFPPSAAEWKVFDPERYALVFGPGGPAQSPLRENELSGCIVAWPCRKTNLQLARSSSALVPAGLHADGPQQMQHLMQHFMAGMVNMMQNAHPQPQAGASAVPAWSKACDAVEHDPRNKGA